MYDDDDDDDDEVGKFILRKYTTVYGCEQHLWCCLCVTPHTPCTPDMTFHPESGKIITLYVIHGDV